MRIFSMSGSHAIIEESDKARETKEKEHKNEK